MHPLQQFDLQPGWKITWNDFTEYDIGLHGDQDMFHLHEDLLQLHHEAKDLTLDLGWYPSFNTDGAYILLLIKHSDWDSPLKRIESRSKEEITAHLEQWMLEISA